MRDLPFRRRGILRAGVIGLGRQSVRDHVPALARRADVEIVAAYDPSAAVAASASEITELNDAELCASVGEMLSKDLDFCVVAVPHDQHVAVAQELAEARVPFMKEKPFARNLDEMVELMSKIDLTDLCFVCTQRRFHPLYRRAHEMLAGIGKIASFNARYTLMLPTEPSGWRASRSVSGGGVVLDMGYHIIDQLVWWFGEPNEITAAISDVAGSTTAYDTEDSANILFRYKANDGTPTIQGNIYLSRCTAEKTEEYEVAGELSYVKGTRAGLLVIDRASAKVRHDEQNVATMPMMDAQLGHFLDRCTDGAGFHDNHLDNFVNMKVVERCYDRDLTRDQTLFMASLKKKAAS